MMMCVAAGAIIALGIGRVNVFANRFKTYRDIISTRTFCYLEEIARTHAAPPPCAKNAKRMIKRGLFKQAALDDGEEFIIMSSQAYGEYRAREQESERSATFARRKRARREREAKLEPPTRDVLSRESSSSLRSGKATRRSTTRSSRRSSIASST